MENNKKIINFPDNFKTIGILCLEKLVTLGSALVVTAVAARTFGPADFGVYSMAIAFAVMLSPLFDLGMFNILPIWLVKRDCNSNVVMATPLVLRLISIQIILLVLIFFLSNSKFESVENFLIMVTILSVGLSFHTEASTYLVALGKGNEKAYVTMAVGIILSILKIFVVLYSESLIAFSILLVVESIALSVFLIYLAFRICDFRWALPELKITRQILRQSWPLMLAGISSVIYLRIDQIMIGAMMPSQELGYYSASVRVSEGVFFIPSIVASVLFLDIIATELSKDQHLKNIQKAGRILIGLGIAVMIIGIVMVKHAVLILFGPDYEAAINMARIGLVGFPFVCIGALLSRLLTLRKKQSYFLIFTVSGALVNIILNFIFIPKWGGLGAAGSSVAAYALVNLIMPTLCNSTRAEILGVVSLVKRRII